MLFGGAMPLMMGGAPPPSGPLLFYQPGDTAPIASYSGNGGLGAYRNSDGSWTNSTDGVPRAAHYEYDLVEDALVRTVLCEEARLNRFATPTSPASGNASPHSTPAGYYTLWMDGTGSIEAIGATDGSYGSASAGSPLNFQVLSTQNLSFTVTGSPTRANCHGNASSSWQYGRRSFVPTATSSAIDDFRLALTAPPQIMTVYVKWVHFGFLGLGSASNSRVFRIGSGTARMELYAQTTRWRVDYHNGSAGNDTVLNWHVGSAVPPPGSVMEARVVLYANGTARLAVTQDNGTESSLSTAGTPQTLPSNWSSETLLLGGGASGAYSRVLVEAGELSRADCRGYFT